MPAGKLHFTYAAMNAGKSTMLLQSAHNYTEMGMEVMLWTSDKHATEMDDSAFIESRIGLSRPALVFHPDTDLLANVKERHLASPLGAVFVDEAQFLTKDQVWQLAKVADTMTLPVYCFGLRTDFKGELFDGAAALLAIADVIQDAKTICHCGRPAVMTARLDEAGNVVRSGETISIPKTNYVSLCRLHWSDKFQNK